MKRFLIAMAVVLLPCGAFAQSPGSPSPPASRQTPAASATGAGLGTASGHSVTMSLGSYTYVEPSPVDISIHGPKFGGEYTGTRLIGQRAHVFAQANVRGTLGLTTYTGFCSPWLIRPDSTSPNGYQLGLGDSSPCSETGDKDWYGEVRGLVGKDVVGQKWGVSPYTGVGFRHLSNATSGTPAFRTDNYLYVPAGVTLRTMVRDHRSLSFNVEIDALIRGWQVTHDSAFGGGIVPATAVAPQFSIDGFSDVAFSQHSGWALRASAKYPVTAHVFLEPYYVHWHVASSPPNLETVTFTVNGVTVNEQLGFYEPLNFTREFGVKLGFHF